AGRRAAQRPEPRTAAAAIVEISGLRGLAAGLARRRRRVEIGVFLAGRRDLLVLGFLAVLHGLPESFHGAAEIRAERAQTLGAENQQRDREDNQELFETNAHQCL